MPRTLVRAARLAALGPIALLVPPALAQQCTTERASVGNGGVQGGQVGQCDLSADGRFVVFTTSSASIVPTGGWQQVARRDLVAGTTELASASPGGAPAAGGCENPRVSADGRWVAFSSGAQNLAPGDGNNKPDIYLRDMQTGASWLASHTPAGLAGAGNSFDPAISADGRYVAFQSAAADLDPSDANPAADVFVFDRDTGSVELVSRTAAGVAADEYCANPSISADGRYVAFASLATTFHPADVNGYSDVFVKDRATGALTLVSARPEGIPGDGWSAYPAITADGRYVAFQSNSTDFGPPDHPMYTTIDVFVRDLVLGTTTVVDRTVAGAPPSGQCERPRVSPDGRFVTYESANPDLVAGDTNNQSDVFLHDRALGTTAIASRAGDGSLGNGYSGRPVVSADGLRVAFLSHASNLVALDTNGTIDAFVRTCEPPAPAAFCAGDGSATACPCGNAGGPGRGCANPVEPLGAHLRAVGTASVSADSLQLVGDGLTPSFCTYFQGTQTVNAGLGTVFGDGLRCAGGTTIRLGAKLAVSGASSYPEAGDQAVSVRGQIPAGGVVRAYQGWYRAAAPFCTPSTFNLTNGVLVTWQP